MVNAFAAIIISSTPSVWSRRSPYASLSFRGSAGWRFQQAWVNQRGEVLQVTSLTAKISLMSSDRPHLVRSGSFSPFARMEKESVATSERNYTSPTCGSRFYALARELSRWKHLSQRGLHSLGARHCNVLLALIDGRSNIRHNLSCGTQFPTGGCRP